MGDAAEPRGAPLRPGQGAEARPRLHPPPPSPYRAEWGEAFRLADHLGKRPIVLNFWASWCYPACYEEAPILEASWRRHREEVLFVG